MNYAHPHQLLQSSPLLLVRELTSAVLSILNYTILILLSYIVLVATPPNSAVDMPSPTPPPNGIAALAPSGSVQPTVIVQPTLIVQSTGIVQPPQPTKTPQTQASTQPDPSVFPLPPVAIPPGNDDIGIGVIIAIVIVFVIVLVLGVLMLVCILTLALRRVSKNQVRMVDSLDNPEYSGKGVVCWNEHLYVSVIGCHGDFCMAN